MGYAPFQLLELSVISAQDLSPVCKKLKTYAMAWINPERKLRTRIDQHGQVNPTWNDKFVFRVDDNFLNSDTSSVMIEIYALGWLKDINVGTIRVLISNLLPPAVRSKGASTQKFVALQIRRRSGRPQGILNMGVTLLDNTMRTMPLYTELSASAVGFQELMDVKTYKKHAKRRGSEQKLGGQKEDDGVKKIQLRRTSSDRTDLLTKEKINQGNSGLILPAGGGAGDGSASNVGGTTLHAGGGGASACNVGSMLNGSAGNASSVNGSIMNGSELCGSDLGPSPSVVAAAVARGLVLTPHGVPRDPGSSILGEWKTEDSDMEGLRSKIERWRTEPPQLRTLQNNNSSISFGKSKRSTPKHKRRHTVASSDTGLFTCFGKAFGCEFTIVCGGDSVRKTKSRNRKRICDSELAGSSALT